MEEKITKLITMIIKNSNKSNRNYFEIYLDGSFKRISINVRNKETHEFIETREVYLEQIEPTKIDELIKFIEDYEEEK